MARQITEFVECTLQDQNKSTRHNERLLEKTHDEI